MTIDLNKVFITIIVILLLVSMFWVVYLLTANATEYNREVKRHEHELTACSKVVQSQRGFFTQEEADHCNKLFIKEIRKDIYLK